MTLSNSSTLTLGLGLVLGAMSALPEANASDLRPAVTANTLEEIIIVGVKRGNLVNGFEEGVEPARLEAADSAGLISLVHFGFQQTTDHFEYRSQCRLFQTA